MLGIQTIAKVMRDHAVRFHIYTVMYGWRLALVPLEPVVLFETVMPVVAVDVVPVIKLTPPGLIDPVEYEAVDSVV